MRSERAFAAFASRHPGPWRVEWDALQIEVYGQIYGAWTQVANVVADVQPLNLAATIDLVSTPYGSALLELRVNNLFNTVLDYLSAEEELQVVDLTTTTHVAQADRPVNLERRLEIRDWEIRFPCSSTWWSRMSHPPVATNP